MTPQRRFFLQKWGTMLGGFLSLMPNGVTWLWGNLSVYVYSYFHAKDSGNNKELQTPWLMSVHLILWSVGMIGATLMEKKLGRKMTTALGMVLYDASFTISYFIFDSSIDLLNLTLGVFAGIGDGVVYTVILQTTVEWADESQVGLITAGVYGGYALGSIVANQFVSRYVNPYNEKPDLVVGPTVLFDQKDIVSRVPNVFLYYGAATAVLYIIGLCLLRERPVENSQKLTSANDVEHAGSELSCDNNQPELNRHLKLDTCKKHQDYGSYLSSTHETGHNCKSMNHKNSKTTEFHHDEKNRLSSNSRESSADVMSDKDENIKYSSRDCRDASREKSEREYSPREILKDKTFYSLWFALVFGDTAYVVFLNYYKIFGQVWIKNDHLLTTLGNFAACVGLAGAVTSGFILDRIGIKATLVSFFYAVCLVSIFYYFTPQISVWVYFVSSLVFASICSGLVPIFTVANVKYFGHKHVSANNGIMFTASVVSNLAAPPIIQVTLSNYGWLALFLGVAALNFISLLLIVCLIKKR